MDFIIKKLHITEKASVESGKKGTYVFFVDRRANKSEIKKEIKKLYGVDAEAVRTIRGSNRAKRFRGVASQKNEYKKAVVTLKEGQSIKLS